MRYNIILLIFWCLMALIAKGQSDPSIWNSVIKVEANKFVLSLPDQWKKVVLAEGSPIDYKFDFTGAGIPANMGGSPLYANFTISHITGNAYNKAMDWVLNDFTVFYDRVTEPGYNYDTALVTIKTTETGALLHSRYYRRSKVSNYSKYYFIVYSPKADITYILALNFQYKDPSYDIERTAHFSDYALQVFKRLEFR